MLCFHITILGLIISPFAPEFPQEVQRSRCAVGWCATQYELGVTVGERFFGCAVQNFHSQYMWADHITSHGNHTGFATGAERPWTGPRGSGLEMVTSGYFLPS